MESDLGNLRIRNCSRISKSRSITAERIFDRLVDEKGFSGVESTIREIVAELKDKQQKAFVLLSYDPGEAIQID